MKLTILLLSILSIASHCIAEEKPNTELQSPTGRIDPELIRAELLIPIETITIHPGIIINTSTGEVKIPEGITIPEAAKAFWKAVAEAYPEVKKEMLAEQKK